MATLLGMRCRDTATVAVARLRSAQLFSTLQQWKRYTAARQEKKHLGRVAQAWHLDCVTRRSYTTWRQMVQVNNTHPKCHVIHEGCVGFVDHF